MAGALSSLKIVEVGEMVSAPYCSKLLADMGATLSRSNAPAPVIARAREALFRATFLIPRKVDSFSTSTPTKRV